VPSPIEMKMASNSDLEFCCVVGTGLAQPIALVTRSETGKLLPAEQLKANLERDLAQVNTGLDAHERLEKIVVIGDAWTIDNGMLTPTFKLIRRSIEKKYMDRFEAWFNQQDKVVFQS
jgi:long-chain acyl-CoA synthetase